MEIRDFSGDQWINCFLNCWRSTTQWLRMMTEVLEWPTQSPDLKLTEMCVSVFITLMTGSHMSLVAEKPCSSSRDGVAPPGVPRLE